MTRKPGQAFGGGVCGTAGSGAAPAGWVAMSRAPAASSAPMSTDSTRAERGWNRESAWNRGRACIARANYQPRPPLPCIGPMPEPITRGERYMPGLDGLRAIAVLAVIFFHLGFGWAPGGLLGVGIFFTLSGYLITDILLGQFLRRGAIHLGRFWLGRARRLLPALFLMLLIVLSWVTIFGPAQPDQFRKAVISAIFYVNNWQQIAANVSYFARFAPEQPLNHLWSLSVEEQFYIFWPFILLIGLRFVHERGAAEGLRPRLAVATLVLAFASAIWMATLYPPSLAPSRVYYGTDTRASELLFGAALAMVWPSRRLS